MRTLRSPTSSSTASVIRPTLLPRTPPDRRRPRTWAPGDRLSRLHGRVPGPPWRGHRAVGGAAPLATGLLALGTVEEEYGRAAGDQQHPERRHLAGRGTGGRE